MAEEVPLTADEQTVLHAVARLEQGDDTATIQRVAGESGLDVRRAEELLGRLATTHDLIRERRTELDQNATGTGREYVVKSRPAPRS